MKEKKREIPRWVTREGIIEKYRKMGWMIESDEHILDYAIALAHIWMEREYKHKGKIKGGPWRKGCGIIGEIIFDFKLNQENVPHVRTIPQLDKEHPVNAGKGYDFKIGEHTIDVKSVPPRLSYAKLPTLNVNVKEIKEKGLCHFYILILLGGNNLTNDEIKKAMKIDNELSEEAMVNERFNEKMARLRDILYKIDSAVYIGWATGKDVIEKGKKMKGDYGEYYQLELHKCSMNMEELNRKLGVKLFKRSHFLKLAPIRGA